MEWFFKTYPRNEESTFKNVVWRCSQLGLLLFSCQVMSDSLRLPWMVATQAPLFKGFPRQEYWSGLPLPSPGYLPDPGIEPISPALVGGFFIFEPPEKPLELGYHFPNFTWVSSMYLSIKWTWSRSVVSDSLQPLEL